jgi:hypothetical protein
MFDSQVLDVAIGLIFVYLFLSIICSVLNEGIAGIFKIRAKQLYNGLYNLLRDKNVLDKLYENPLIIGMAPKKGQDQKPGQPQETSPTSNGKKIKKYYPSYISSSSFALALLDSVKDITVEKEKKETGQEPLIPKLDTFQNIRSLVEQLPPGSDIRRALLPLIDTAQGDFDKALRNIENWYDNAMDRISGWFKRFSQLVVLFVALFLCIFLNADTFMIGKTLYKDQTLRASIVASAQGVAQKPSAEDSTRFLEEIEQKAEPLQLPLGWVCGPKKDPRAFPDSFLAWITKIFGILFTVLAISLGAPFWFDMLNKITNIRAAGKKPLTAGEEEKMKR